MKIGETQFTKNLYSWNLKANMLYISQPAGVGYSYCPGGTDECSFDDDSSAEDNMAFLVGWYNKFPEYKSHDLYISGGSYAGIYVPLLSQQIADYNAKLTD